MRQVRIALLPFLLLLLGGCSNKEKAWYQTLRADQVVYESLTDEIQTRYEAGDITEERFEELAEISERWGTAHNAAVNALLVYHHSKSQTAEQTVLEALLNASMILNELKGAWER